MEAQSVMTAPPKDKTNRRTSSVIKPEATRRVSQDNGGHPGSARMAFRTVISFVHCCQEKEEQFDCSSIQELSWPTKTSLKPIIRGINTVMLWRHNYMLRYLEGFGKNIANRHRAKRMTSYQLESRFTTRFALLVRALFVYSTEVEGLVRLRRDAPVRLVVRWRKAQRGKAVAVMQGGFTFIRSPCEWVRGPEMNGLHSPTS